MKKILAVIVLIFALAGCASITKGLQDQAALVQAILSANLPEGFNGPAELHIKDSYLQLDIVGTGITKDAKTGLWTWTAVKIDRVLKIPWFAGLTYTRELHITEGKP